jgi:hypothetical protein
MDQSQRDSMTRAAQQIRQHLAAPDLAPARRRQLAARLVILEVALRQDGPETVENPYTQVSLTIWKARPDATDEAHP